MFERTIERYGKIIKEENLWSVNDIGVPNTCILESMDPYFGYYAHVPDESKPKFIYFITKTKYPLEDILRAYQRIRMTFPDIDIAASQINLNGEKLSGIRIRNLEDYAKVGILQEKFLYEGIKFFTKQRNVENVPSIITTNKFFKLQDYCEKGIFMDMIQTNNGYFVIPVNMDWQNFKKLILYIKNNNADYYFDAAMGFFYDFSVITDIVRIYTKNNSYGFMNHLKQIFLSKM